MKLEPVLLGKLVPDVARARALAMELHGAQQYGERPYVSHLDHVAQVVLGSHQVCDDEDLRRALILAYLHDVIEDVDAGMHRMAPFLDSLSDGKILMRCLDSLSKVEWRSLQKRKLADYYAGIREYGKEGSVFVKLCDRIANLDASISCSYDPRRMQKYLRERDLFARMRDGDHLEPVWKRLDHLYDYAARGERTKNRP